MNRPKLDKDITVKEFEDNYWLKAELVAFCRETGIVASGGKAEIHQRIVDYLTNGRVVAKTVVCSSKSLSSFDWNIETLHLTTTITDSYRNTENVRAFFRQHIGSHFKFNVEFMNWMKANRGKTLADAIDKWNEISLQKKDKSYKTEILPQFEYNTYIRDFLTDNPHLTLSHAIKCWKIKRQKPGPKKYENTDLLFSE